MEKLKPLVWKLMYKLEWWQTWLKQNIKKIYKSERIIIIRRWWKKIRLEKKGENIIHFMCSNDLCTTIYRPSNINIDPKKFEVIKNKIKIICTYKHWSLNRKIDNSNLLKFMNQQL